MKKYMGKRWTVIFVFTISVCGMAAGGLAYGGWPAAQTARDKTLIVNGKSVTGAMVEMQGRTYVDLQMLSQSVGGTLTIETDKITLAIPAAGVSGSATQVSRQTPANPAALYDHLSPNFRSAAIAALGEMRQWQGAMESVVTSGFPVVGSWPQDYRDRAESGLNQAKVAAVTDEDRSAAALLENAFSQLRAWSDTVVTERKNLNAGRFVDPNALKNDTALGKLSDCSRFLAGMISGGTFSDNSSCH
jgi:hypothetical protein